MTNSQIRDFEFVLNRCIKDITVVGPTITFNAEWDMVVQQNGNKLFYQVSLGPSVPPVTTLPAATGVYVMGCDIDVEKVILCETITPTNIVQFVRVKVYNASTGEILVTRDFELDETTPYTVVDENNVTACGTEANVTYTPNQNIATNGAPVVLPAGVRSFTVSNLGLNGEGLSEGVEVIVEQRTRIAGS